MLVRQNRRTRLETLESRHAIEITADEEMIIYLVEPGFSGEYPASAHIDQQIAEARARGERIILVDAHVIFQKH